MILVDGHNLLYAARARFAAQLVDGHPGTAARDALVDFLAGLYDQRGQDVRVYFDGGEPHAEQRSPEVQVIYPGGRGDQRADRAILAALREQTSSREAGKPPPAPIVVTRDLRLAKRARRRGAVVLDPAKFLADCDAGLIP
ncbi:MAG: NYN domain-containing protein [Gammaproteobacteria bacterium]|jgi:predicted RNA-binding protein with PIN domain